MKKPYIGIFLGEEEYSLDNTFTLFIMKLCYAYGADVVAFHAKDIDKENNTILAYYWTPQGIKSERTLMPHKVECGPHKYWHKYFREKSQIIDDYILSKKDVSDAMLKSKFASFVIPTMYTSQPMRIFTLLNMWPTIIVKPLVGARGEGIITIEKTGDEEYIFSNTEKVLGTFDSQGCMNKIANLYNGETVIVQPRLKFTNKDGQTMDFRINATKGAKGEWNTIYMIARTGRNSIVSNLSKGGYASLVEPTLAADFGENAEKILNKFKEFAKEVPPFMEEISDCNMLSLGIDIGIDYDTLNPYIIEVNYVPQVTFRGKARYADSVAQYYAYLTEEFTKQQQK